jgi:hypothetical protein
MSEYVIRSWTTKGKGCYWTGLDWSDDQSDALRYSCWSEAASEPDHCMVGWRVVRLISVRERALKQAADYIEAYSFDAACEIRGLI